MTRLRRLLREKGFTGKTFAKACGIGHSIIYKYMCGSRPLSPKVAARFAKVLKVAPEELLGEC
ncbi:MAG: helix-turn-helix domain-containing protein [Clostridiales bacterium]|nr:helix-turn-helix domain-containing protein [Clostridiales bacterium]